MRVEVDGHSTFVYTGGQALTADKPSVVFIHGAQQDHSCWALQSRWFAYHGFNVIAPDLPAHGQSKGEPLASIEAMSAWLLALLYALQINQAALIGHSMGSLIALETSLTASERVTKLVLIGTALPMPVAPILLDAAREHEAQAATIINHWSYSATGQLGGSAMPGLWLLGMNQRLMARQTKGVFYADLSACNAYQRAIASLSAISQSVLIIAGSQDRMTSPKATQALLAIIPQARWITLAGAGHAMMAEQPDAVLDNLIGFLA